MLQRLREKAHGWFAWVILGAIAVTFVLFGTSSFFESTKGPNQAVAKVNGSPITERELEIAYNRALQGAGAETLRLLDPKLVKAELLQSLIDERILLQSASKMGMTVSTERLNDSLKEIPFLQDAKGQFSPEAYGQFLASSGYSDQAFRKLIRDNILQQELQGSIAGTSFSLPSDINDYVKFSRQKRQFRYTTLDKSQFKNKVSISDEELQKYYEAHLSDFMTPEQVSIEYLQLSLPELAKNIQYTDTELHEFYRDNLSAFTIPASAHVAHILISSPKEADAKTHEEAKAKLANIQKELAAGKSFGELAKEYSSDKMSGEKNGELEWFTAGEMVPEFEKAVFALEPNQISQPVQTDFGYHLIKLIDKKPEQVKPFFEVKDDVIAKYKKHQAEEKLIQLSDEVSQILFDSPETLHPAAEKIGKATEKTELFSQESGPANSLLNRPEVIAAAFSSNVKDDKNNSELIKLDDENYVAVRLADWVPAKQKPFDTVKSDIKDTLVVQKTNDLLKAEALRIEKLVANSKDLPEVKALSDFRWETKDEVTRNTRNLDGDLLEAVFAIPRPLDPNKRELKTTALSNGDYAVVWLLAVKDGDISELSEAEKKTYETGLQREWGKLEFSLYITDQINKAKVKKLLPASLADMSGENA